jgi:serine/threonine protein kinase
MSDSLQSPASVSLDETEPVRLSGHRILGKIGAGGMGTVWLAMDEQLNRKVAIKTLHRQFQDDPVLRTRFMQEARAIAMLSHPNIVQIYSLGAANEQPHFVMEYLEGTALGGAAAALSLRQKVVILFKLTLAVHFLHQHHIIHRDLKPSNVRVGPDLEPKLMDFGLARVMGADRLTLSGEVLGTPEYLAPEQTSADAEVDARSDVFALGAILYELTTGSLPFHGETCFERLSNIRQSDPILPRRLNSFIAGDLQKVILKALEKDPSQRYQSGREMAEDLERFLAGEPVLAEPTTYSRQVSGKIDQHVHDLNSWRRDQILSEYEYDALKRGYDRLIEKEDAWIMEVRRLSLSQVTLYLGAWLMVLGEALVFLFRYEHLNGTVAVVVVTAASIPTGYIGLRSWRLGFVRTAVAYLLGFCLMLPITFLVVMGNYHLFGRLTQGREDLEFFYQFKTFQHITHAQLWWAIVLSVPVYLWLRRFTKSSVFSLVSAVMLALLSVITLLRFGAIEWFNQDPGRFYLDLVPFAFCFFVLAITLERLKLAADSRYFYPVAVLFTVVALSGVAGLHEPYANWLRHHFAWTHGNIEYLFIINAGIYFILQAVSERFDTAQMRTVAKIFRFLIPGHVMTSLLILGLNATRQWEAAPAELALLHEARVFEIILPLVAGVFIFASIPKQMKNFLASGLLFLAIGVVRLQQNYLKESVGWPIALIAAGVLLMLVAIRHAQLNTALQKWMRRIAIQ